MSKQSFTPGPWRWEINQKSKSIHLVGGVPQYDLTVMDFVRWGMGGASIRLRDPEHDGLQLMYAVQSCQDWIRPFAGREHHAHWCADVVHPDARLIASSPLLLEACRALLVVMDAGPKPRKLYEALTWRECDEKARALAVAAIAAATGEQA